MSIHKYQPCKIGVQRCLSVVNEGLKGRAAGHATAPGKISRGSRCGEVPAAGIVVELMDAISDEVFGECGCHAAAFNLQHPSF